MTLPASGTITLAQFRTEMADTGSIDLSWIASNTKSGQVPSPNAMGGYYSKAWYQRNMDGNCNNGNCNCSANCGALQCNQCYASQCVNCTNCDARSWLQNNCNCACTYNCNSNLATYNCNCCFGNL